MVKVKIIKSFFTPDELELIQCYCRAQVYKPNTYSKPDPQVPYTPTWVADSLMESLLKKKLSVVEKATNLKLFKTYSYWRYYVFGSQLINHTDRPACEVSITACISKTHSWPLIVDGKNYELEEGDGLVYPGCEVTHGRPGIFEGECMAQVFLHYVNQNGPHKDHQDDRVRKALSCETP